MIQHKQNEMNTTLLKDPDRSAGDHPGQQKENISDKEVHKIKVVYAELYDMLCRYAGNPTKKIKKTDEFIDQQGITDLSLWEKLILKSRKHEFDLPAYIFFALRKLLFGRKKADPSRLLSDDLIAEYQETRQSYDEGERIAWKSQERILQIKLAEYRTHRKFGKMPEKEQIYSILLLRTVQFSPLFLFVKAIENDISELRKKVQEEALTQYRCYPTVYDDIFEQQNRCPKEIREHLNRQESRW